MCECKKFKEAIKNGSIDRNFDETYDISGYIYDNYNAEYMIILYCPFCGAKL